MSRCRGDAAHGELDHVGAILMAPSVASAEPALVFEPFITAPSCTPRIPMPNGSRRR